MLIINRYAYITYRHYQYHHRMHLRVHLYLCPFDRHSVRTGSYRTHHPVYLHLRAQNQLDQDYRPNDNCRDRLKFRRCQHPDLNLDELKESVDGCFIVLLNSIIIYHKHRRFHLYLHLLDQNLGYKRNYLYGIGYQYNSNYDLANHPYHYLAHKNAHRQRVQFYIYI